MSTDRQYELAVAECHSLRRQLKEAYSKCNDIYEALSLLDEHSTKERTLLESLVSDLRQTIRTELDKNEQLTIEKLQVERKEKHIRQELHEKSRDLHRISLKYRRIYIKQQQEKFIQENLIKNGTKK
jgi:hypothetical protein